MKAFPRETLEAIFWTRVKPNLFTGCWEWQGYRPKSGYGFVSAGGKHIAHRLAYEWTWGPIPEGLVVMHTCDNRACVNPNHLELGTTKMNVHDMMRKGRGSVRQGEKNFKAKLTESDVREIRRRALTPRPYQRHPDSFAALAREFGVTHSAIGSIVSRRNWGHVE